MTVQVRLEDIPRLTGYEEPTAPRAGETNGNRWTLSRRGFMRATTAVAITTGLQAMQVYRPARQALANYDIYRSCPSYAADHNCDPICGPSLVCSNSSEGAWCCGTVSGRCGSWHKSGPTTSFQLRPNQCVAGTGWDGWIWQCNGVNFRCHDGRSLRNGQWINTICRYGNNSCV